MFLSSYRVRSRYYPIYIHLSIFYLSIHPSIIINYHIKWLCIRFLPGSRVRSTGSSTWPAATARLPPSASSPSGTTTNTHSRYYLKIYQSIYPSIYLSAYLSSSIYLSISFYLSISLSIYLSILRRLPPSASSPQGQTCFQGTI